MGDFFFGGFFFSFDLGFGFFVFGFGLVFFQMLLSQLLFCSYFQKLSRGNKLCLYFQYFSFSSFTLLMVFSSLSYSPDLSISIPSLFSCPNPTYFTGFSHLFHCNSFKVYPFLLFPTFHFTQFHS